MTINDPFLEMQAKLAALEYVQKFTLQVLYQLYPQSKIGEAMLKMLEHSIPHANVDGIAPEAAADLREYVKAYGAQIINAGFNARSAST